MPEKKVKTPKASNSNKSGIYIYKDGSIYGMIINILVKMVNTRMKSTELSNMDKENTLILIQNLRIAALGKMIKCMAKED